MTSKIAIAWVMMAAIQLPAAISSARGFQSASRQGKTSTFPSVPRVIVAVEVHSSDFMVTNGKFRVFYAQMQRDHIPLQGYDFRAALTDELLATLSEDKRMQWRAATEADGIDVHTLLHGKKPRLPEGVDTERVLLVEVYEFGAVINFAQKDCYISSEVELWDRGSGKRVWRKSETQLGAGPRVPLPQRVDELQADNQKGLKEVLNQTIEKYCRKRADELRKKNL